MPVSKQEIRALKNADAVCFDYIDGESRIRAIKNGENNGSGFDQTVQVECETQLQQYTNDAAPICETRITGAYHYANGGKWNERMQTIWGSLREGDTITLQWSASTGNGYLQKAHTEDGMRLFRDTLTLKIRRSLKNDVKHLVFSVNESICPANSARMIKEGYTL